MLRARDWASILARRASSPVLVALTENSALRYCAGTSPGGASLPMLAGQPPRQIRRANSRTSVVTAPLVKSPSNRPRSDTAPEESPLSNRLIVRMGTVAILPAPLWETLVLSTVDEPVSRYCPRSFPLASMLRRTASHTWGTSCHSSMTWGDAPTSANEGPARTALRLPPRSTYVTLSACANEDHVLPHHLVPETSTAPKSRRYRAIWVSTMRGRYRAGF